MVKITYNQVEELVKTPYRSTKNHFDIIGVEPVERRGNKVFFKSSAVLQLKSAELRKGDEDFAALLDEEKHRRLKRENDLDEKLIAPVELLTEALEKSGNIIVPILESLPLRIKQAWPEATGDHIQLIKKAIADCRNAIADSELEM